MQITTVSQLNAYIKNGFDSDMLLQNIWVKGEISNFKQHYSGHMYMSLKDEGSVIRAVMFRGANTRLIFKPSDGMMVLARGRVSVFERDGQYQLYIDEMQPEGLGELYAAFEQLKEKLRKEGLFEESRKKTIPVFPEKIGVITSLTGAALQDILNILGRRYKLADVYIYPVLVQGAGASEEIANAIKFFNDTKGADVLIVGRGGGSIEDLWAFNEEVTARAIAGSVIPVISAVGHETDFTICDFVSDLRAPTPSAAAELAVPSAEEIKGFLRGAEERLKLALKARVDSEREKLNNLSSAFTEKAFKGRTDEARYLIDNNSLKMENYITRILESKKADIREKLAAVDALSPLKVMLRGYSVALNTSGNAIKSIKDVSQEIKVIVSDGTVRCNVLEIKEGKDGSIL